MRKRKRTHLCPIDWQPIYRPDQQTCSRECNSKFTRMSSAARALRLEECEEQEEREEHDQAQQELKIERLLKEQRLKTINPSESPMAKILAKLEGKEETS